MSGNPKNSLTLLPRLDLARVVAQSFIQKKGEKACLKDQKLDALRCVLAKF